MKVILKATVRGLGAAGTVVDVAPGYARNLLLPKGLAETANAASLGRLKTHQVRTAREAERAKKVAESAADQLQGASVAVKAKAGEHGRLFGSVTAAAIASAAEQQLHVTIDRRRIEIEEPIKQLGEHTVTIHLHPDLSARLSVRVEPVA